MFIPKQPWQIKIEGKGINIPICLATYGKYDYSPRITNFSKSHKKRFKNRYIGSSTRLPGSSVPILIPSLVSLAGEGRRGAGTGWSQGWAVETGGPR
jgi:hypothetical protein